MRRLWLSLLLMILTVVTPALADRGTFPLEQDPAPEQTPLTFYEPAQQAIIAFNGKRELLLLSTSVRASGQAHVGSSQQVKFVVPAQEKVEDPGASDDRNQACRNAGGRQS